LVDFFLHTDERLVVAGDLLNLIPYGLSAWREPPGRKTILQLSELIPPQGFDWIKGNHEASESWMRELLPDPRVRVADSLELYLGGRTWHIEHGHRFSYWKLLAPVADEVSELMAKVCPGLWYGFMARMGWIPSRRMYSEEFLKGENPGKKYNDLVGYLWAQEIRWAAHHNKNLIVGHSHTRADISLHLGIDVVDCGARQEVVLHLMEEHESPLDNRGLLC
jgi:metallophosphoesterase superfamily enzyme